MVRVLITGGFGYLGARLAQHLRDGGQEVVLLVRDAQKAPADWAAQFTVIEADVLDAASVKTAFDRAGDIDAVIHLAAVNEHVCAQDPELAFAVNCFGTQHVLDASKAKRFIYLSTFHVYGEASVITEMTVPNPLHVYGITHLAAEQLCKASAKRRGTELAIIRFSNGVGAPVFPSVDRWTLLMLDLCRQAHEKGSVTLLSTGSQLRDFISIDDLGQAVTLLLTTDAQNLVHPVFNVGSGRSVSVRELTQTIRVKFKELYGEELPLHAPPLAGEGRPLVFSIERIGRLGFVPSTDLAVEAERVLRFCEVFR